MADFVLLDGVFDGALDLLLPHHVLEDLRTVFAVQRLVHGHTSLLTNKINESSAVSHRAGTLAAHG